MKKSIFALALTAVLMAGIALAMDHGNMGGGGKAPKGVMIRDAKVDGFGMAYHLIDNAEEMKKASSKMDHSMMEMKSHHLMLYLSDSMGMAVTGATVGYLVVSPGGDKSQAMAMAMEGGYGADIDLKAKGKYTIKVKAVAGQKTLIDEFPYELK